jgi:hypothetical protein
MPHEMPYNIPYDIPYDIPQQNNGKPMAPMMDSTEPKTELKKHYESAQTQKTRTELKEKAAPDDKAASDDDTESDDDTDSGDETDSDGKVALSTSELYKVWIVWCVCERDYGFAILHRIKAMQALSRNTNTSTTTTIDKMISRLKILYREHLEDFQSSWAEWTAQPAGDRVGEYDDCEFTRITYEIEQTLALEDDRDGHNPDACRRRGGCCRRACGCCSKPLQELYIYSLDERGRKGGVSVYAHCTTECLCCNRYYGTYEPHPRLPKVDPALFKAVAGDDIYFCS